MNSTAKGEFSVKVLPKPWRDEATDTAASGLGRFLLDKQYHGDLEATADGQMLASGDGSKGSSGVYVAIERVTGTLHGRKGSFVLYHTGVMHKGVPEMTILISPDSGTDELAGISGSLTITVIEGKHNYALAYTLGTIQ